MKLEQLEQALQIANEYGLTSTDVEILCHVAGRSGDPQGVTIMAFSRQTHFASVGTLVTRVKRMVKSGFLTKTAQDNNLRIKRIELGPRANEFIARLAAL